MEDAHAPRIKEVCTAVKTVKNKAWHLEGVGGQLVLEGHQRCLAFCSLGELGPQDDSSWEEALLLCGVRNPDLVEARVVASSHASRWSQVWLYWYVR